MAKNKKSNFTLPSLKGILIGAKEGIGMVPEIILPQMDDNFLVVTPQDIMGSNKINVLSDTRPLLASTKVNYIGEPILALFGLSLDRVKVLAREIKIIYHPLTTTQKPRILRFKKDLGDFEESIKDEDLIPFESTFKSKKLTSSRGKLIKVHVTVNGEFLNISCQTQWPQLIKNAVALSTGFNKRNIIINREPFYAPYDEYWIKPAHLACIAAVAAIKSGLPIEIFCDSMTHKIETTVKKTTWYNTESQTVAEKVEVKVDQGAYPLFGEELCSQMLAGLVPEYPLKGFRCTIAIMPSHKAPANFFGDLGYSAAVAASEIHSSKLGIKLEQNPYSWRLGLDHNKSIRPQIIEWHNVNNQRDRVQAMAQDCFYNRKNAACQIHINQKTKLSLISSYARGIGIASAPAISGFSSSNKAVRQQAFILSLPSKRKVICNSSFMPFGNSIEIWKDIISKKLKIKREYISMEKDDAIIIDSGPSVLSAKNSKMPKIVSVACDKIEKLMFEEDYPLTVTVSNADLNIKHLFSSNAWASIVVELQIDPVSLEPLIYHVWSYVIAGKVSDKARFTSRIKQIIITTLFEQGAKLAQDKFQIDIDVSYDEKEISDTVSSNLKGITIAAFSIALNQAMSCDFTELPINSDGIVAHIGEDI